MERNFCISERTDVVALWVLMNVMSYT
uniref:Uncharacterized protein n=1 Tax=Anguilla anguilla TaxID=7936 RepID=A0A0E9V864_ANGAN